jgi:hypothetical protein
LKGKIRTVTFLAFLVLIFASSIQTASATSIHYELDKPYYHPGDTGKLLLVCNNDEPSDYTILRAEMNIDGIGTFKWDMSAFPNGYEWKQGQTVNIEIYFRMPADAQPRVYRYTWLIERRPGSLITYEGRLEVYAVGEEPSQSQFPTPLVLIPLLILAIVATLIIIRRRGRKRGVKAQPTLFACPHCGRDLSMLPKGITICPYCGERLTQRTCPACGRGLSQFPIDIKNYPYCGKAISIQVEAMPFKIKPAKVELPESMQRIRRYAKMTAISGLLIAVTSFILGPFLGGLLAGREPNAPYMFPVLHEYQGTLGTVALAGILIAVASALVRAFSGAFKRRGGE